MLDTVQISFNKGFLIYPKSMKASHHFSFKCRLQCAKIATLQIIEENEGLRGASGTEIDVK